MRYKVFDGYAPPLRSLVGIRQCSGAGLAPDAEELPTDPGRFVSLMPGYAAQDWNLS